MKIIDFHTHLGYNSTKVYGFDLTPEMFVENEKRAGISLACGSALDLDLIKPDADYEKVIPMLNGIAWKHKEMFSDFIYPGIHIHPNCVETSVNELEKYASKGVKLVGELVPQMMGQDTILSKNYLKLFEVCDRLKMVVSIHITSVDECSRLCEIFPDLTVVMAHPAYLEKYRERLEGVKKHKNLYLDLSGTGIASTGMLRYGVNQVGKEKLIFGTDAPGYNPEMYVRSVYFERITDTEMEYIFHKNAERLLEL